MACRQAQGSGFTILLWEECWDHHLVVGYENLRLAGQSVDYKGIMGSLDEARIGA